MKEGGLMSNKNQRVKREVSLDFAISQELAKAPIPTPVAKPVVAFQAGKPFLGNSLLEAYQEALIKAQRR